ncbi:hypothetical protein DPMN_094026 [Dreissena polymorpha]|uniref:Uncharacterized protein n=1 Tax=Dreissena polymorpha TaxID=45954 RepID=A0A9D4L584_DREPO|nr:hypothetical protein DPMN_094026 [Dreissena polymorpha]
MQYHTRQWRHDDIYKCNVPWFVSGVSYINCGNSIDKWRFDCCGSTTKFTFYAQTAGSITLHIWRPKAGTVYTLVGRVTHAATSGERRKLGPYAIFRLTGTMTGLYIDLD